MILYFYKRGKIKEDPNFLKSYVKTVDNIKSIIFRTINIFKWTRRDLNPRPLRCERNDLPLIYEPFKKGDVKDSFPGQMPVTFSSLNAVGFQNLNVLYARNFCKYLFYNFGSAFFVVNY
jgi:hypothetical protein